MLSRSTKHGLAEIFGAEIRQDQYAKYVVVLRLCNFLPLRLNVQFDHAQYCIPLRKCSVIATVKITALLRLRRA